MTTGAILVRFRAASISDVQRESTLITVCNLTNKKRLLARRERENHESGSSASLLPHLTLTIGIARTQPSSIKKRDEEEAAELLVLTSAALRSRCGNVKEADLTFLKKPSRIDYTRVFLGFSNCS